MAINYSNVAITKVLLLRGNTIQNDRYLGLPGEPTIDLEAKTLRIHDGVTVGGHEIESTANLSSFSGNIIPSANSVYSLGSITNQWHHLYVSSNTIYIGGTALTIANGNLTVGGNAVTGTGSGNVANLWNSGKTVSLGTNGITTFPGDIYFNNNSGVIEQGANRLTITGNAIQVNTGAYFNDDGEAAIFALTSVQIATDTNSVTPKTWDFSQAGKLTFAGTLTNGATFDGNDFSAAPNSFIELAGYTGNTYVGLDNDSVFIQTNWSTAGKQWTFGTDGTTLFPDQAIDGGTAPIELKSRSWSQLTYNNSDMNQQPNKNHSTTFYVEGGDALLEIFRWDSGNVMQHRQWTFSSDGSLSLPDTGSITFPDNTVQTTAFSNAAVSSYLADTTLKTFGDSVTITGNLTVQGNLFLTGNTTLVSTNNLIINDNIIYVANANPGSSLDIGFVGHFTSTAYQHTGLVRQATSNQWQLFSNVVAEPGATIDFTNAVYDDIRVGNITSPTIIGINANVATANVGIKGYVDLANTIQSAQLTAANTAWAANASAQQTLISSLQSNAASQETEIQSLFANSYQQQALIGNLQASAYSNVNVAAYLSSQGIGGGNYSNVNVAAYLTTNSYLTSNLANLSNYAYAANVTSANVGMKGYVDLANSIQSAQMTAANVGIIGYIDQGNTIQAAAITAANVGMLGYVNSQSFYSNAKVATYLQAGNIANVSVAGNVTATYFVGNGALLTGIAASSNYGNVQVAQYLQVGNIANISVAGNVTATYFVGNGSQLTGIPAGYSNVQTAAYLNATGYNLYSNVNVAAYLSSQGIGGGNYSNVNVKAYTETIGLTNYSNVNTAAYTQTMGYTNYSNVNVAAYIPTHTGNVGVNNLIGTTPNVTLVANSYSTTYDIYGNVAFGNALYPVQVYATGNISTSGYLFGNGAFLTGIVASGGGGSSNYSNVNVKAYTETIGLTNYSNVNAKAYTETMGFQNFGNVNVAAFTSGLTNYSNVNVTSYLAGNITVGNIVGAQPNVYVQAGAYTSVFDNSGNVTVPALFTAGNIQTAGYLFGNGAFLTGITTASSSYSNVQVATYLPTYSGNIANITLSPSGILTFADGTTQTTAGGGGSNYSNSNVASYLISSNATFIGNTGNVSSVYPLQSNIQQFFIGSQTSILSGAALTPAITYLLNNLYYDAAGNQKYRNTQTGATSFSMGSAGFSWAGTTGAVTANAASGIGSWLSLSGSGLSTNNSLPITAAGALTTTSGTLNSGAATAALFNTTATTINLGGVATAINMGSTGGTGNVFFGGNAILQTPNAALGTNLYPLVLRPAGQYNYILLYGIAGGYNSPPYTSQSLTGGNGSGMTASYSSVGGYVSQSSLVVTNPGTGYKNGDILTLPGGGGTTVLLFNYNPAKTSNTASASYTFGFDGNLTLPGNIIFPSSSYIYGDFSNATVNSRTVFVTTGNSTTTGIYAAPSGTGTGAAWQAANSSNLTAASKIMITTNGSTDVQLVSGINGAGTYLPLSFYNNGAAQMQLTVAGNLAMTANNSISTSGTGYFLGNSIGITAAYTGNVTAGGVVATQYGNSFGTTATYTGNIYAANFFGNITSGSTGNLNVVGNLISTGYGFFPGAYNEQATTSGVFIGNTGSGTPSPRIGFYNGNVSQNWQVDNYFGQFRWFTPGITQMNLDNTGSLTVTGNVTVNGANGVAMPLRPAFRVYGQGGSIGLNANLTATNWTVDYTQGNSAAYLNGTNGTFTAPVAGLYQTSLTARTTSNTNSSGIQAVIQQIKSGSKTVAMMIEWGTNTTFNHATGSTTVKLAVGDKLVVQCISDGGTGGFSFDGNDHWDVVYLG